MTHDHNHHDHAPKPEEAEDLPIMETMEPPPPNDRVTFREALSQSPDPSLDGQITLLGVPRSELEQLVVDRVNRTGRMDYLTNVRTLGSWDNISYFAAERSGSEVIREAEFVNKLDPENFTYVFEQNGRRILGPGIVPGPKADGAKELSGRDGRRRIQQAAKEATRRIPLYCSGFCIDIRRPLPREISDLIAKSRFLTGEYESQMGALYYLFYDRLLKTEFVSLLMDLVVFSSCPKWDEEGVLLASIDYADYPAILAHIAAIMYPKGYPGFRHFCRRPVDAQFPNGCDHVDEITGDILKMIRTRFGEFTPMQVAHMQKAAVPKTPITREEIESYRESFGFINKTIAFGNFELSLRSCSLADHLEAAATFNAALREKLKNGSPEDIMAYIAPRSLVAMAPYVASAKIFDEETRELTGVARDRDMIEYVLDIISGMDGHEDKVTEPLRDYISNIQLSYVCYPTFACPKCGYEPTTPKGFYVVDPQSVFFTTALKLFRDSL